MLRSCPHRDRRVSCSGISSHPCSAFLLCKHRVSPQPGSVLVPSAPFPHPDLSLCCVGHLPCPGHGRAHLRQVGEAAGKIPGSGEMLEPPALPTQPRGAVPAPAVTACPLQTKPSQVFPPSRQPAPNPAWVTLVELPNLGIIPELF